MAFEVYDRRGNGIQHVKISDGRIVFSKACLAFFGNATGVQLLIDRERKMAGVKQCDPEDLNAYRLRFTPDGGVYISARSFCRELKIERTERQQAMISDGMLAFSYDLTEKQ